MTIDEFNLKDGLKGIVTIRDNNGNIILKQHNTIVNDGRKLALALFANGIQINETNNTGIALDDTQLNDKIPSDSRKIVFPILFFGRNNERTSRDTVAQDVGVTDPKSGYYLPSTSNINFDGTDINITISYTLKLEGSSTLSFNDIKFAYKGTGQNELLYLFSRICVDTTILLPNSSYNLEYKIYF